MSAIDELSPSLSAWCCPALERALSLSALRARFGPRWGVLVSTAGTWWATTGTSAHWSDESYAKPEAIEADSPGELAAAVLAHPSTKKALAS